MSQRKTEAQPQRKTEAQLVNAIAAKTGVGAYEVKQVIKVLPDVILEEFSHGTGVLLPRFAKLTAETRKRVHIDVLPKWSKRLKARWDEVDELKKQQPPRAQAGAASAASAPAASSHAEKADMGENKKDGTDTEALEEVQHYDEYPTMPSPEGEPVALAPPDFQSEEPHPPHPLLMPNHFKFFFLFCRVRRVVFISLSIYIYI